MNLESGWLIAASLSWRLSGGGGACYRNLFSRSLAPNLVKGFEGIGEGKKTKMVTPFRNMARSFTSLAARWLVHSLAHELAASPEATIASGLACSRSLLAYVVVGLPTRTRPPECLLGSGRSQAETYDRRRKDPHFIAPGERKFDRGLGRRGGRKGSGWI
ncbi:hypothetical protein LguiA_035883 [Lonicera macranthoides]